MDVDGLFLIDAYWSDRNGNARLTIVRNEATNAGSTQNWRLKGAWRPQGAPLHFANAAELRQIGNDANASILTRSDNAAALALTRLVNAAAQLPYGSDKTKGELVLRTQLEREATALQSGEMQGEASPL